MGKEKVDGNKVGAIEVACVLTRRSTRSQQRGTSEGKKKEKTPTFQRKDIARARVRKKKESQDQTISASQSTTLMRRRVSTTIRILSVCGSVWARSADGLPGDFSGFFARLLEVAVVAPQVGSVLAAAYKDATGPGCADASGVRVVLELGLGDLICGAIVLKLLDVAF